MNTFQFADLRRRCSEDLGFVTLLCGPFSNAELRVHSHIPTLPQSLSITS